MDKKQLAALLNGREFDHEITLEEAVAAKAAGLVVVFGSFDGVMKFRGAIHHKEAGLYESDTVLVDAKGVLGSWCEVRDYKEIIAQGYFERKPKAKAIQALFGNELPYDWTYKTDIPHETFEIVEDGEPYCRGIVFSLADLAGPPSATITLTDDPATGEVTVAADFGERVIEDSQAHQMAGVLLQSILGSAQRYQEIEDTAPELNVEPSRIIAPN